MRPPHLISIRGLGLWLLSVLLAACVRTSTPPANTTPTTAPIPTPTAILAPTATPPPSPEGIVAAYLSAWQKSDYAAMYALLAPESQATLSAADFEKHYRDNLAIMSTATLTATVTEVSGGVDANSAQAQAHVTYTTVLVGTLEAGITFPLKRTANSWGVVYSPALIWPDLINGQTLYMAPFPADRGGIYDRNGEPMVKATRAYAIGLVPGEIQDEATVQDGLARLLRVPRARILSLYQYAVPEQYLPVAEASADEVGNRFSYLQNVPGVVMEPYAATRFYYGGGAAAHVTSYVSPLQPDELTAYLAQGYARDQSVGRGGLEAWGEAALAGRNGGQLMILDANNQVVRRITGATAPIPSQDIYSTVDFELQKAVQFALGDFIGAAVVLDVHTGAVLAIASTPTYDPNLFDPHNRNSIALSQVFDDQRRPLINRAAQSSFPAGSVFKVVTMSAGMTSGLFTPETEYTCNGKWEEIPGLVLDDWKEGGHGTITLKQGLAGSCNPYFWHIGYALFNFNPKWLSDTARAFGLGQATGIAQIEETPGQIPDPDWKLKNGGAAWEPLDSLNLSIGQGDVLVTPLQLARMMAAIGNGGTLYQPQLVLRIQPPDGGNPTFEFAPIPVGQLPLKPDQLAALQEAMHDVTRDCQGCIGTARNRFRGLRIPIAGKTGTAEDAGIFGTREPDSWFAGYTFAERADQPDIAIAVVVQNQGEGSEFAAPIFRRLVESYFGLNLTRYPWESSVGVVATPEPTPTEGVPAETETPTPQP